MTEAPCPYYGTCGGCSAQHIPYEVQLENKRQQLAHIVQEQVPVTAYSGPEYGYRNRVDMVFHPTGIGFREKGKWYKAVDIARCAIAEDKINQLVSEIREFFAENDAFHFSKRVGTFRYAVIRVTRNTSLISFILNEESSRQTEALARIDEFVKITSAENILVGFTPAQSSVSITENYRVLKGQDELEEVYLGKTFTFAAQGFFQTNTVMAEKMHQYVHELLTNTTAPGQHLLDLYGGVGTFGILNAKLFESVLVVESVEPCITSAKKNAEINETPNVSAEVLDAKYLKRLSLPEPLTVITDPPRSGMNPKTIKRLIELAPEKIIYVSCNLKQLKADLPKFDHYEVKSAALFDLFPHTPHCEGVLELARTR